MHANIIVINRNRHLNNAVYTKETMYCVFLNDASSHEAKKSEVVRTFKFGPTGNRQYEYQYEYESFYFG